MSSSNSIQFKLSQVWAQRRVLHLYSFLLTVLFLSTIFVDAHAQINKLQIGDRVRITAPLVEQNKIMGTVKEVDKTVLVLAVKDSSFYISESLIHSMEISTGRKRLFRGGMIVGAVSGIMLSGLVHSFAKDACGVGKDCVLANKYGEAFLISASIGLVVGAAVGGVAGFFTKVDQWERVPFGISMDAEPVRTDFNHSALSPTISVRISINK
ncbi:MAG: hypothetical protein R3220_02310 [Balneolaceae bacterium]|nr:hypothetical protein [Balneolaceae bacterium]